MPPSRAAATADPPFLHLQHHDARQEDPAGHQGDARDRRLEAAHHPERRRRPLGDLVHGQNLRAHQERLHVPGRAVRVDPVVEPHREVIHLTLATREGLQVGKVKEQPRARRHDPRRIRGGFEEAGDQGRAGFGFRSGPQPDHGPRLDAGPGGVRSLD